MQHSIFDLSQDEIEAHSEPIALEPLLSFKAIAHSDLDRWTAENLKICSLKELQTLSCIIGIPHSGKRDKVLPRLVALAELLYRLRRFDRKPDEDHTVEQVNILAQAYSGEELKAFCKIASIYAPSTKYGMAAALIKFRRSARRRGMEFVAQAKSNPQKNRQLGLF